MTATGYVGYDEPWQDTDTGIWHSADCDGWIDLDEDGYPTTHPDDIAETIRCNGCG